MFSARLSDELIDRLNSTAKRTGINKSDLARQALAAGLDALEKRAARPGPDQKIQVMDLGPLERRLRAIESLVRKLPLTVRDELLEVLEVESYENDHEMSVERHESDLQGATQPAETPTLPSGDVLPENDVDPTEHENRDASNGTARAPKLYLDANGDLRPDRRIGDDKERSSMESRQGALLRRVLAEKKKTHGWTNRHLAELLGLDEEQLDEALRGRADMINTPSLQGRLNQLVAEVEMADGVS